MGEQRTRESKRVVGQKNREGGDFNKLMRNAFFVKCFLNNDPVQTTCVCVLVLCDLLYSEIIHIELILQAHSPFSLFTTAEFVLT